MAVAVIDCGGPGALGLAAVWAGSSMRGPWVHSLSQLPEIGHEGVWGDVGSDRDGYLHTLHNEVSRAGGRCSPTSSTHSWPLKKL